MNAGQKKICSSWSLWFLLQVLVPSILIMGLFPLLNSGIIAGDDPFGTTFAGGDLLLLGALLSVGLTTDIRNVQRDEPNTNGRVSIDIVYNVALAMSIVLLVAFAIIKVTDVQAEAGLSKSRTISATEQTAISHVTSLAQLQVSSRGAGGSATKRLLAAAKELASAEGSRDPQDGKDAERNKKLIDLCASVSWGVGLTGIIAVFIGA